MKKIKSAKYSNDSAFDEYLAFNFGLSPILYFKTDFSSLNLILLLVDIPYFFSMTAK